MKTIKDLTESELIEFIDYVYSNSHCDYEELADEVQYFILLGNTVAKMAEYFCEIYENASRLAWHEAEREYLSKEDEIHCEINCMSAYGEFSRKESEIHEQ